MKVKKKKVLMKACTIFCFLPNIRKYSQPSLFQPEKLDWVWSGPPRYFLNILGIINITSIVGPWLISP